MFIPADNMQIDENALNKIKDENTVDGFSKKLDIVRYKVDEDVRDIPVE